MREYCGICDEINEITIRNVQESYSVKGEKIPVNADVAHCNVCGNVVRSSELEERTLNEVFSIFRKRHNLLSPDQIAEIRSKYSLSQRSLAKLLEWGIITITRYENGSIQDPAHNEVLMFIEEPKNMLKMFKQNGHLLNKSAFKKLNNKLQNLINEDAVDEFSNIIDLHLSGKSEISEFTGFTRFDSDKIKNMILYLISKSKEAFLTKLNKLMWYSDFLYFKNFTISISGSMYIHHHYGPVPEEYELIIESIIKDEALTCEEVTFPNNQGGLLYSALIQPDLSLFNKSELEMMDFVVNYFSRKTSSGIKKISHEEKAYKETQLFERISYKYAKSIPINVSNEN